MNTFAFSFNWYGFLVAIGLGLSVVPAYFLLKKRGFNPDMALEMVLVGLPICFVFSRIYYCWSTSMPLFWNWFKVWEDGGLSVYGAIIGAVVAAVVLKFTFFRKRGEQNRLSILQMLDLTFAVFLLGQAVGGLGNYDGINYYGEALQTQTGFFANPPFAIAIGSTKYSALFFYESLLCFAGFGALLYLYIGRKKSYDGFVFSLYAVFYGVVRIIFESMRIDTFSWGEAFEPNIFFSVLLIIAGVGLVVWHLIAARYTHKKPMILVDKSKLGKDYYTYEKTCFCLSKKWVVPYDKDSALSSGAITADNSNDKPKQKTPRKFVEKKEKEISEFDDDI